MEHTGCWGARAGEGLLKTATRLVDIVKREEAVWAANGPHGDEATQALQSLSLEATRPRPRSAYVGPAVLWSRFSHVPSSMPLSFPLELSCLLWAGEGWDYNRDTELMLLNHVGTFKA